MKVALERNPAHRVLAEYQRSASLLLGSQPVARVALFFDSGGYSRTNRYQIDETKLDSRLLVVLGALDEMADREGATYYSFDNGAFRRLHTIYVRKHRCDVESGWPADTASAPDADRVARAPQPARVSAKD